ncbi:MAG: CinA family protein [Bacillota bacterium]|nr:CinA family protein [Bacillota bacterium]
MTPDEVIYENSEDKVYDTRVLAAKLTEALKAKKMTVSTAESCTGGLIAAAITDISGSSEVFHRGYVTYANSAKHELLGVKEETLENYGAVSLQTAYEMAAGVRKAANSDVGISVTGIAGPSGGTEEKPVGLVYAGIATEAGIKLLEMHFNGSRDNVRCGTVYTVLKNVINTL